MAVSGSEPISLSPRKAKAFCGVIRLNRSPCQLVRMASLVSIKTFTTSSYWFGLLPLLFFCGLVLLPGPGKPQADNRLKLKPRKTKRTKRKPDRYIKPFCCKRTRAGGFDVEAGQ